MSKVTWIAWTVIACAGCATGGAEGEMTLDPSSSTDSSVAIDGGKRPVDGGKKPIDGDAAGNGGATGGDGAGPGMTPDGMVPPVTAVPNYGTFVIPQLTSAGKGSSAVYRLSLRIGAPQPYGHGAGVNHRVSLGTALGR